MDLTKLQPSDWISLLALLTAFIFYLLGRRYTDQQFAATQFPDLTFDPYVDTRHSPRSPGKPPTTVFTLQTHVHNVTNTPAVNLHVRMVLTSGFRRIAWTIRGDKWQTIEPLSDQFYVLTYQLTEAMQRLRPDFLEIQDRLIRDPDSSKYVRIDGYPLAVKTYVNGPPKVSGFSLVMEFRWYPPLRAQRMLKKSVMWHIKLVQEDSMVSDLEVTHYPPFVRSWMLTLRPVFKHLVETNDMVTKVKRKGRVL